MKTKCKVNVIKDTKKYFFIYLQSFWINIISLQKKVFCLSLFILNIIIQRLAYDLIKKQINYSEGKQYINKCLNYTNIIKHDYLTESPLLSVIIPAYNCEKTIFFPIISVQNQNISNFEIILINDFSLDNTSEILKKYGEQDRRIKIINNKKNMGTLYSRCIATLISKGEYIFPLDNDDMIFGKDILDILDKKAKEGNYDIVGFKAVYGDSYNENIRKMRDLENYSYQNNLIIKQPELSTWLISINGKYQPHSVTLWGKLIKSRIYVKAIHLLGKKRYSTYISWAEDTSMNFIIFNIAQSFIFIHKYGIYHLISPLSATSLQPINNKLFGLLFLLDIIFDYSSNNEVRKYSVFAALYIMKYYHKDKPIINMNNLVYLKNIIFKIKKSKYIDENYKNILLKKLENFLS